MNLDKLRMGPMLVLSILLLMVGGLGYWVASGARRQAKLFREDTLGKLQFSAQLNAYQAEGYALALRVIDSDDPQLQQKYWAEGYAYRTKIDGILKEFDGQIAPGQVQERRAFDDFVATRQQYRAVHSHVVDLATNGQATVARQLVDTDLVPAYQKYTQAGDVLYSYEITVGDQRARELDRACSRAQFLTAVICVGVFLGGIMTLFVVFLLTGASQPAELTH
jgi:hypothetical protein